VLAGAGRIDGAVEKALDEAASREDSAESRDLWRDVNEAREGLVRGDLRATAAAAARVLGRPGTPAYVEAEMTQDLLDALDESGDARGALAAAQAYWGGLGVKARLTGGESPTGATIHFTEPYVAGWLVQSGRLDAAQLEAARGRWRGDLTSGDLALSEEVVWLYAVADSAATPDLARRALEMLAHPPTLRPHAETGGAAFILGRLLFLARDFRGARPYLEAAAHECNAFNRAVGEVRAASMLGEVDEALKDEKGACAAYATVLDRWGRATPKSVTADRARGRARALRCSEGL
jgi:serine/threonine-protein kinase